MKSSLTTTNLTLNPWRVFAVVAINVFMATIDGSAVNMVLPAIAKQFDAPLTRVEWVSTIYLLIISVSLLPIGAIAPRLGERRIYMIGIVIFTVSSVFCALSNSLTMLVASRALQGVGSAFSSALGAGFIASAFPIKKRGMALGMIGTVVAAGSLTGPIFGGFIAGHYGTWSAIFWINLPIGIAAILLSTFLLKVKPLQQNSNQQFDHFGAALSGLGLLTFLFALSESGHKSVFVFVASILVSIILFYSFVRHERHTVHPMLPLEVFKNHTFTSATIGGFLTTAASIQALLTIPFYLHEVMHADLKTTGMFMAVWPLSLAVVAPLAGRAADRIGSRLPSLIGPIVQSIGLFLLSRLQQDSSSQYLIVAIAITGVGGSIFVPANNKALLNSAPKSLVFLASSMMALIRNIGMVAGIALSAAMVQFTRSFAPDPQSAAGFLYGMHWSMYLALLLSFSAGVYSFVHSHPETDFHK